MRAFARTIGIDYSGAETPTASLKGLRVYSGCRYRFAPQQLEGGDAPGTRNQAVVQRYHNRMQQPTMGKSVGKPRS